MPKKSQQINYLIKDLDELPKKIRMFENVWGKNLNYQKIVGELKQAKFRGKKSIMSEIGRKKIERKN